MNRLFFLFALLPWIVFSSATISLVKVGSGSYTWFGIKIYDAAFYAPESFNGDYQQQVPLALRIKYDIDIDKDDLIETTMDEWESIAIGRSEQCQMKEQWSKQLLGIWPNLKQGDELKLVVDSQQRSTFYFNEQSVGGIDAPEFAICFLSIWLAADSSADDLREDLLDLNKR